VELRPRVERWRRLRLPHRRGARLAPGLAQPLRDALDWLRDELAPRFEERAPKAAHDPWAARDDYIDVVLDRGNGRRIYEQQVVPARVDLLNVAAHYAVSSLFDGTSPE
jgi:hypothetical protein